MGGDEGDDVVVRCEMGPTSLGGVRTLVVSLLHNIMERAAGFTFLMGPPSSDSTLTENTARTHAHTLFITLKVIKHNRHK